MLTRSTFLHVILFSNVYPDVYIDRGNPKLIIGIRSNQMLDMARVSVASMA